MDGTERDWATNYDIFDDEYVLEPFSIWDSLRSRCPVAHTERSGGSWLTTRYADVMAIARDVEHFSSREVGVLPSHKNHGSLLPAGLLPIQADPPDHTWARQLLLPWFSPPRVAEYEKYTRDVCRQLISVFLATGRADAATQYAQQVAVRVIAVVLGVPESFAGLVRTVLEYSNDVPTRRAARARMVAYFSAELERRRSKPGDDLVSALLQSEVNGAAVPESHILGTAVLTLIAGVDTTWSAVGSAIWHLATNRDDQRRLASDPTLIETAVEELLRAYSPVTMARIVASDTDFQGCSMRAGDRVLLSFPAANRDPDAFPDADRVVLDRAANRHIAFGVGIHRCVGSNLARMEMRVALEEWMAHIPEFRLAPGRDVTWTAGQVRGPDRLPVVFP